MRKNEVMIQKPSAMIQTNVSGLTPVQRKFINALIHIAQKDGDRPVYSIALKHLRDICNFEVENNHQVKAHIRTLRTKSIEYNILGKDRKNIWVNTPIIGGVRMENGTGILEFEIPYFIKQQVLNPDIYAPLDIVLIAGFNSTYTIVLYEFLRDYLDSPKIPQLPIDQFRKMMGVDDGTYKLFKDFREGVLDVASTEMNEKTDLACRYELTKENGNRYTKIQWFVTRKTSQADDGVPFLEDRPPLPAVVLTALPEKHRTEAVFNVLRPHCVEPLNEAFVVSNIRYAIGKAKKNFAFYLSKSLDSDFARATREGETLEKQIVDRKEEVRLLAISEREKFDQEGKDRYEALHPSDLEHLQTKIRAELLSEGYDEAYMNKDAIKVRVIERLMGVDRAKEIKQESLF